MEREDLRSLERRHLIYYLEVYDDATGKLLGHLVDITTKGIKLVSKEPVPVGRVFRLRMHLPEGYFEEENLRFAARSLWSSNDINPEFYDTGFAVEEMDEAGKQVVAAMVSQLGFNE